MLLLTRKQWAEVETHSPEDTRVENMWGRVKNGRKMHLILSFLSSPAERIAKAEAKVSNVTLIGLPRFFFLSAIPLFPGERPRLPHCLPLFSAPPPLRTCVGAHPNIWPNGPSSSPPPPSPSLSCPRRENERRDISPDTGATQSSTRPPSQRMRPPQQCTNLKYGTAFSLLPHSGGKGMRSCASFSPFRISDMPKEAPFSGRASVRR